ncbi:transposase, partial [Salmonella enterica subsp. diarizonae]|nr:transposase [Salmonella enterica subsp. diarizonae]
MWVTAKECMGVKGFPTADKNVRARLDSAVKDNPEWRRKREGTKAFEYHVDCLAEEIRQAVITKIAPALPVETTVKHRVTARDEVGIMEQCPAVVEQALHQLTDAQKAIASARILLAVEVHTLREHAGMTRTGAIDWIVQGSRTGNLPPRVLEAASVAN